MFLKTKTKKTKISHFTQFLLDTLLDAKCTKPKPKQNVRRKRGAELESMKMDNQNSKIPQETIRSNN